MARTIRDPNGWTPAQAIKAWKAAGLYLNPENKLGARAFPCSGQSMVAGAKTTRGCMHGHAQPCPGGPMVFELYSIVDSTFLGPIRRIDAWGDSWQDCITKLIKQRDADRALYQESQREAKPQKRKQRRAR